MDPEQVKHSDSNSVSRNTQVPLEDPEVIAPVLQIVSIVANLITITERMQRGELAPIRRAWSKKLQDAFATLQDIPPHLKMDLAILQDVVQEPSEGPGSLDFGVVLRLSPVAKRRYDEAVGRLLEHMKKVYKATTVIESQSSSNMPELERWDAVSEDIRASREELRRIRKHDLTVDEALEALVHAAERSENALNELNRLLNPYLS